jgi:two-component system KDP operon response regulator KdpE
MIITRRQILISVWDGAHRDDVEYLRVYVRQLRGKLGDDPANPRLVETEPGVGHRSKPNRRRKSEIGNPSGVS